MQKSKRGSFWIFWGPERVVGWLGVPGELCCKSELFPQRLALSTGSFENDPFVKPAQRKRGNRAWGDRDTRQKAEGVLATEHTETIEVPFGTEVFSQLGVLGRPCSKSKLLPQGPAVVHGCIEYATIVKS
jgi:hypothetical protein